MDDLAFGRPVHRHQGVRPPRLVPGDRVAICTPSSPGPGLAPQRFERGLQWLRDAGFEPVVGSQAFVTGRSAGSARDRAAELNQAFQDPAIRAVVTTIGGYTSNGVLRHLDFEALRSDPKVVVGYSDITTLLLAAFAKTGVVTFHGPTLMPELAEFPEPEPYTGSALWKAVTRTEPIGVLQPPGSYTDEFLLWDVDDSRRKVHRAHPGWEWQCPGQGRGRLIGGNLETIGVLIGTPFMPCTDGAVLFWETCATDVGVVDRQLTHLESAGLTDGIAGMIVGRSFRAGDEFERELAALVSEHYAHRDFPVVVGVDLGHTDPMVTLPIGVEVRLDSGTNTICITDGAVR